MPCCTALLELLQLSCASLHCSQHRRLRLHGTAVNTNGLFLTKNRSLKLANKMLTFCRQGSANLSGFRRKISHPNLATCPNLVRPPSTSCSRAPHSESGRRLATLLGSHEDRGAYIPIPFGWLGSNLFTKRLKGWRCPSNNGVVRAPPTICTPGRYPRPSV